MDVTSEARHGATTVSFEEYIDLGYNYRLTDIQAAVGREQLKKVPEIVRRRRELADRYGKPSQPVEKLLQVTETRLDAKAQGLVLIAQKKDVLELKWQRVADMPDLSKLEPSLRRRFRLVPNMPVMVRVSLAGISDVLAFIQTLLVAFSSLRKGNSLE